jgi:SAM-dependent methyltransferase
VTSSDQICPSCHSSGLSVFYELQHIPVNSMLLLATQEQALNFPTGDLALGFCKSCGFISNIAFDSKLLEYSSRYEATQTCSQTFNSFHRNLAARLIERYDLHDKDIVEIGCGQGEFLSLICELGGNRGIGFDPCYDAGRKQNGPRGRTTFVKDYYSEQYASHRADLVICKMTLEHIPNPADFVTMVRRSITRSQNPIVFFQVPDTTRILQELAFWDIYYEHCSYFTLGSLARLFRRCGFDVIDLVKDYDDQYLMIAARPGAGEGAAPMREDDLRTVAQEVDYFSTNYQQKVTAWRLRLQQFSQKRQRVVVWGAGSKAVAFLTTLDARREIEYAVDINPHKQGTYLAGTGQRVVAPAFLREYKPDIVIVMNPIYRDEIEQTLHNDGIESELVSL